MQYDKLELLKILCASETPVTLKSLINSFNNPHACGCEINKAQGKPVDLRIYSWRSTRDENKPYVGTFEVKLKGLVYTIKFTTVDKSVRTTKTNYLMEDEVIITQITRRMISTYDEFVVVENENL
jgi:hypothetical protein